MGTEILPEIKSDDREMSVDLIIKLMGDVEKMGKSGVDKKDWVKEEIRRLNPKFYEENGLLIDALIDGFVLVATNPEMIQAGKRCCSKIFKCNR